MKKTSAFRVLALSAVLALLACTDDDSNEVDEGPCVPLTCQDEDRTCGAMATGCGGLISCGTCTGDSECRLGTCREACVPNCDGKCGGSDGCESLCRDQCSLTGRTCDSDTQMCIGDCVPRTCRSLGVECGTLDDWCGDQAECGECLPGADCTAGKCSSIPGDGLGVICRDNPEICREPFPDCILLSGDPAFCTRKCLTDGQCGIAGTDIDGNVVANCCVPINGVGHCISGNLVSYLCADPTDPSLCTIDETCLPSPLGACVFCFAIGEGTLGQECEGFNSCVKGLSCVKLTGDAASTCHEICDPADLDACTADDAERHCVALPELGDWGVCRDGPPECDPADLGEDCPTGWNCVPDGTACAGFVCAKAGGKQVGEPCAEYDHCARGGYCIGDTCQEMCSVSNGCPDAYECVQGCSTKIKYCTPVGGNECNPIIPDWLCLAQQTCVPNSVADCTVGTCIQPGKTGTGGGCVAHSDCVSGDLCYNSVCRDICTLTDTCAYPAYCFYVCSNVDLGVCMSS